MNGEVGCSSDVPLIHPRASLQSAVNESPSCQCNRQHKENCKELGESRPSSDAAVSPGQLTDDESRTSVTNQHSTQFVAVDNSTDRHQHFSSQARSQSQQKLTNGTDEGCSVTTHSCKDEPAGDDDDAPAVCQSVQLDVGSGATASCVSESTRLNILDAAETFASIIGREIAASFDLKDGDEEMRSTRWRECRGDDDERGRTGYSLTQCSTTTSAAGNSTRTLEQAGGLGLLGESRHCEAADVRCPPALDTAEVARRVRDILTANSVGQRQFARYVLGLSQGTVSELLAKPKPWDRLTEKGKESYRRMNQWAGDHLGVMSLKGHLNSVTLKANLPSPKGSRSCFFVNNL